jgi:predicted ABC-type ATPase
MPTCWIIAGPNGAGKTTFAMEFLPGLAECSHFINADLIASGLNPLNPKVEQIAASRIFLQEIKDAIIKGNDFAFETTLSGKVNLRLIQKLRNEGWDVELLYVALPSVDMCKRRVAERVAHGGHDIPAIDIERRFFRSLSNLFGAYTASVTRTRCFMNQFKPPKIVFENCDGKVLVKDSKYYELLNRMK